MVTQKPFRFGVVGNIQARTRGEWIIRARLAEALGYDTLLVPDHFSLNVAPIAALMAAADATTSIRIGSHVFANDFRSPTVLAKEVATIDMLSGGRLQFGIGCGVLPVDYQQASVAFDEPKVRVDRFLEALYLFKHYFTDEVVNLSGKYYSVKNLKGCTTHLQKPYPPIYIGGARKRMLTIATREADIVGIGGGTTAQTREKLTWLQQAAPDRFDSLELAVVVFIVQVTVHRKETAQCIAKAKPLTPAGVIDVTAEQALDSTHLLIGTVDQIVETLLERRERLGISYIQIPGEYLESFAPVVERLAGK